MELLSVDYDAVGRRVDYDPMLHWSAPWTDRPVRDDAGTIVAWERTGRDGGTRIVPHIADGNSAPPAYRIDRTTPYQPVLLEAGRP